MEDLEGVGKNGLARALGYTRLNHSGLSRKVSQVSGHL